MVFLLIDYLVNLPTNATSPIFTAVNTAASLATQGTNVVSIPVFDTRPVDQTKLYPPYVRCLYTGENTILEPAISNGAQVQTDRQIVAFECAATGNTPHEASYRAEKLRLATLGALGKAKSYAMSGSLTLTDDGGTGSTFKVSNFQILPSMETPVAGPGPNTAAPVFTRIARIRLEVWCELVLTN